jgi:hypothetical protein
MVASDLLLAMREVSPQVASVRRPSASGTNGSKLSQESPLGLRAGSMNGYIFPFCLAL